MRILADENFPRLLVSRLRDSGHDVLWVREAGPGSPDPVVLALAQSELRVMATFDTGFGELAFHARLPAECGVLLIRAEDSGPEALVQRVLGAIQSRPDWRGVFGVITPRGVRIRPLPSSSTRG